MKQRGYDTLLYFTLRTDEDEAKRIRHPAVVVFILIAVHDVTWL